jgi:2'-5' RNA ligase
MKIIQKYFLALIPPAHILEKAHHIKQLIRDEFGVKYALKSPPHITMKMPFNYNEAKEEVLEKKLFDFLEGQGRFLVKICGVGTFGNRVIYLNIEKSPELALFQSSLKTFCKRELNLVDELSDRNYHPHLTVAFKDIKPNLFPEIYKLVEKNAFDQGFVAEDLVILKRVEHNWKVDKKLVFGG